MCHTIAEPHSGKYLFCCSPEAVRVWSYETAIECHDSIMCPRPKETGGAVEMHADSTMLQDMKVMIGSIQDAFVSIWLLDVNQLRPFNNSAGSSSSSSSAARNKQQEPSRAPVTAPYAHQQQSVSFTHPPSASTAQPPLSARNSAASSTDRLAPDFQSHVAVSNRPTTPAVALPPQSSNALLGNGNPGRFVEGPRRSCTLL